LVSHYLEFTGIPPVKIWANSRNKKNKREKKKSNRDGNFSEIKVILNHQEKKFRKKENLNFIKKEGRRLPAFAVKKFVEQKLIIN
jgi:hypothetical protein